MAVTITDHRTVANEADAITNWTGSPTLFTADPDPIESTGSIGYVVSTATVDAFVTITSANLSNKLVYVWVFPRGAMDTRTNGGISIHLGDGTDRIAFHLAGSDVAAFRHETGPVGWQCLAMDTSNVPSQTTVRAGSLANLTYTAITQIGATFKTLAKSVGGVSNCFVDVIRYGDPTQNNGAMITVTGGTSGDPGKFSQIAAADRATGNLQGYGIVRELGSGLYGIQGPIRFGNATGTASSWFEDTNASVVFEARGFGTSRYKIVIVDNGTGTTTFKLGNKSGTGTTATGNNGCSITVPSGVGGEFDASTDTDVTDVFLYGSTFTGFTNGFKMRTGQEFISSRLVGSGLFTPGGALVYNSEITGSTATQAMEVTSVAQMNNVVGCTFSNNNRAIRITAAGTYTFDRLTFSGNTYDVENASTGLVTINATNGSNVTTFINTNGGTTTIVNSKTLTISNIIDGSEVRILRQSDLTEFGGAENVGASPSGVSNVSVSTDPNNAGRYQVSYSYGYTGDVPLYIAVLHVDYLSLYLPSALLANGNSLTVFQTTDRQYARGSVFTPG